MCLISSLQYLSCMFILSIPSLGVVYQTGILLCICNFNVTKIQVVLLYIKCVFYFDRFEYCVVFCFWLSCSLINLLLALYLQMCKFFHTCSWHVPLYGLLSVLGLLMSGNSCSVFISWVGRWCVIFRFLYAFKCSK